MEVSIKQCPFCFEEIRAEAIKCKHCGSMLNNEVQPASMSWIKNALQQKFDIHEIIGKGGMATIYRAYQNNIAREVALKVIHPHLATDEQFVKRFFNEGRNTSKLSHKNIVTVYDAGELNGIYYLSMEYLKGRDLASLQRLRGSFTVTEALKILIPISEALSVIHQQGMIHRDLKPGNIFITDHNIPVLMDFGIAHAEDTTKYTQTGALIGTPHYMSPEQAKGQKIDGTTDIFSFGVVLYLLVSGKLPFSGDNNFAVITNIINNNLLPLKQLAPDCPVELMRIVHTCLMPQTEDRYQSAARLTADLMTVLESVTESNNDPQTEVENHLEQPGENTKTELIIESKPSGLDAVQGQLDHEINTNMDLLVILLAVVTIVIVVIMIIFTPHLLFGEAY